MPKLERVVDAVLEHAAVGEVRQRIVERTGEEHRRSSTSLGIMLTSLKLSTNPPIAGRQSGWWRCSTWRELPSRWRICHSTGSPASSTDTPPVPSPLMMLVSTCGPVSTRSTRSAGRFKQALRGRRRTTGWRRWGRGSPSRCRSSSARASGNAPHARKLAMSRARARSRETTRRSRSVRALHQPDGPAQQLARDRPRLVWAACVTRSVAATSHRCIPSPRVPPACRQLQGPLGPLQVGGLCDHRPDDRVDGGDGVGDVAARSPYGGPIASGAIVRELERVRAKPRVLDQERRVDGRAAFGPSAPQIRLLLRPRARIAASSRSWLSARCWLAAESRIAWPINDTSTTLATQAIASATACANCSRRTRCAGWCHPLTSMDPGSPIGSSNSQQH